LFRVGSAVQYGICDVLLGIPSGGQGPKSTMVKHRAEDLCNGYWDEKLNLTQSISYFHLQVYSAPEASPSVGDLAKKQ
jgi:hypothetical protein